MAAYLFLWKATMQYHVVCELCIKVHKKWWPKDKIVGIWRAPISSFGDFSQRCFVVDCQRILNQGNGMELFPRTVAVLTPTSLYRHAFEGVEELILSDPTPEQIAKSAWEVLE